MLKVGFFWVVPSCLWSWWLCSFVGGVLVCVLVLGLGPPLVVSGWSVAGSDCLFSCVIL